MSVRGLAMIDGQELFIGFRSAEQASLYFNQDPVYQFNSSHELRRVFYKNERYAAYSGQLCCLVQSDNASQGAVANIRLTHQPVSAELVNSIVQEFQRLRKLILETDVDWEYVGTESQDEFAASVQEWLAGFGDTLIIAESPAAW